MLRHRRLRRMLHMCPPRCRATPRGCCSQGASPRGRTGQASPPSSPLPAGMGIHRDRVGIHRGRARIHRGEGAKRGRSGTNSSPEGRKLS
eukprot:86307-Pyramimonas_sp.AAC.1